MRLQEGPVDDQGGPWLVQDVDRRWHLLAVKTLVDALNGKKVPTTINILHQPGTPLIIDRAFLKAHPNFKADWSL